MNFATAVELRKALLRFDAEHEFAGNAIVAENLAVDLTPQHVRISEDMIEFRGFVYRRSSGEISVLHENRFETYEYRFQVRKAKALPRCFLRETNGRHVFRPEERNALEIQSVRTLRSRKA